MSRPSSFVAIALLLGVLLAGCSDTSFVGKRVDNVTAYYNTFYNANRAFDEGVESLEREDEPVDTDVYLPLFLEPPENAGANQQFEEAIRKSADVLRDHPRSKWVDDALLLIGKSYFYQGNDVGAQQKFEEVIPLATDKEGEARLWLARTLIAAGRYEQATSALNAGLGDDLDFGTWTDRMYLARGELYVRQARWDDAASALDRGLSGDLPADLRARASFLLGQVRETQGRYAASVEAYDRAADANPRYELQYAARVSAARVLGLHVDAEAALARVDRLLRDDKNFERRDELQLLRGRLLRAHGDVRAARTELKTLLYDDEDVRPSSDVESRAHYALALLYRDALSDFTTAAAHFDTAATRSQDPAPGRSGPTTPSAITDSRVRAEQFGGLADHAQTVARLDSLLRLGQMPPQEFRAYVEALEAEREASLAQQRERQREEAEARRFATRSASPNERGLNSGSSAAGSEEAGFLYHKDPVRVQQGRRQFERVWGNRPRVPNWRRLAAIQGTKTAVADGDSTAAGPAPQPGSDAEPAASGIDVSDVPRTPEAQDEMRAERASARYQLANALFLSAGRPDSAAVWYRRILEEDAEHPVARRALYALAEVRYSQGKTEAANDLYRSVLEKYPNSEFADRARQRLGMQAQQSGQSSALVADRAYRKAYAVWQEEGDLTEAQDLMQRIPLETPDAPAAPKAMLAVASIYLEQIRRPAQPPDPSILATYLDTLRQVYPDVEVETERSTLADETPGATPSDEAASDEAASNEAASNETASDENRAAAQTAPSRGTPVRTPRRAPRRAPARTDSVRTDSVRSDSAQGDSARANAPSRTSPSRTPQRYTLRRPARSDSTREDSSRTDSSRTDATNSPRPTNRPQKLTAKQDVSDSLGVDTLRIPARSVGTDSTGAETETAAAPLAPTAPLKTLLAFLKAAYPDTPQAARAEKMLTYLQERETASETPPDGPSATPDSTTTSDAAPRRDG